MRFVVKCILSLLLATGWAAAEAVQPPDIEVFVREGCPHCAKAEAFLGELQVEQPQLRMLIRDVSRESAALERLRQLAAQHGTPPRVPAFIIGDSFIVGYSAEAGSDRLIRDSLGLTPHSETFSIDFFGRTLTLDGIGLPLFTLAMGLLDGFNPCSMWVLILMISLLAPLNDRPRMLAIAGTFIAVQGIAYFMFMAAWLNIFLLIGLSRASEIVIAVLALVAGAIHLKDAIAFGRGVSLSIPAAAKPGIYARMRRVLQAKDLTAALLGTVLLGVLVQVVELLCTSGFPALYTRILTLYRPDALGYYGYLLLYDAAYMLDDMVILAIGVATLGQRRLQENEGRRLKLISGMVMVGLGVYLLLR